MKPPVASPRKRPRLGRRAPGPPLTAPYEYDSEEMEDDEDTRRGQSNSLGNAPRSQREAVTLSRGTVKYKRMKRMENPTATQHDDSQAWFGSLGEGYDVVMDAVSVEMRYAECKRGRKGDIALDVITLPLCARGALIFAGLLPAVVWLVFS